METGILYSSSEYSSWTQGSKMLSLDWLSVTSRTSLPQAHFGIRVWFSRGTSISAHTVPVGQCGRSSAFPDASRPVPSKPKGAQPWGRPIFDAASEAIVLSHHFDAVGDVLISGRTQMLCNRSVLADPLCDSTSHTSCRTDEPNVSVPRGTTLANCPN
jgi:hypothetical protein